MPVSNEEKDEILFRMIKANDPYAGTELMQRFQQTVLVKDNYKSGKKPRTVKDMMTKVLFVSSGK